jgi:hypothetical protein
VWRCAPLSVLIPSVPGRESGRICLGAFLKSGRPRGPGKALNNVGGEAPNIFGGLPGPRAGQNSKMHTTKPARLSSGTQTVFGASCACTLGATNRYYTPVSATPVCRRMGKLRNRIEYLEVDTGVYEIKADGKPSELTGFEAMDVTMVSRLPCPVSCVPRVLCSVSSVQRGSQIEGKPIQLGSLCPDDWQHSLCPDDCPDDQGNRCA